LCPNINHNIANITIIKNRKHGGSISHLREVIRKSKLCIYLIFTIFKILNPSTISISNILHINKIDNQKYKKIINKFVDINNITKNPTLIFFFQNYHFIELYSNKNNLEFIYFEPINNDVNDIDIMINSIIPYKSIYKYNKFVETKF
jgi:hypothetical protein